MACFGKAVSINLGRLKRFGTIIGRTLAMTLGYSSAIIVFFRNKILGYDDNTRTCLNM